MIISDGANVRRRTPNQPTTTKKSVSKPPLVPTPTVNKVPNWGEIVAEKKRGLVTTRDEEERCNNTWVYNDDTTRDGEYVAEWI